MPEQSRIIGNWSWDLQNGDFNWSPEMYEIYQIPFGSKNFTHDHLSNLTHVDDQPALTAAIEQTLASGIPYDITYRLVLSDSTTKIVRAQGHIERREDGRPAILSGTLAEVTSEAAQFTSPNSSSNDSRRSERRIAADSVLHFDLLRLSKIFNRIAFLENDVELIEAMTPFFSRYRFSPTFFRSYEEAIEFVKLHSNEIDLFATDSTLPNCPLQKSIPEVRAISSRIPVLVFSDDITLVPDEVRHLPRLELIEKPYTSKDFYQSLAHLNAKCLQENQR